MTGNDADGDRRVGRRAVLAAGVAGAAGLAGCSGVLGGGSGGSKTVTFGQPAVRSGDLQSIQPPVSAASDMAVQAVNEAGGPLGRTLELPRRDTANDPLQAKQAFRDLVDGEGATVLPGFTSSVVEPLWSFFQREAVPIVSMYAGARFLDARGGDSGTPDDTADDDWVWRTTTSNTQQTAAAAIHASSIDAYSATTKVGVVHTTGSAEKTWADAFLSGTRVRDDARAVRQVPVRAGKPSYAEELASLYDEPLDVVGVAMGVADASTLLRDWEQAGYGGNVMLANTLVNPDLVDAVGGIAADASGWVRTPGAAMAGPYADVFTGGYETFVTESDDYADGLASNEWSAAAYDAVTVSALAVHAAGEDDPEAVQRTLGRVARPPGKQVSTFAEGKAALDAGEDVNYVGAATQVDFTDTGDVSGTAAIRELSTGGFANVTTVGVDAIRENLRKQAQ